MRGVLVVGSAWVVACAGDDGRAAGPKPEAGVVADAAVSPDSSKPNPPVDAGRDTIEEAQRETDGASGPVDASPMPVEVSVADAAGDARDDPSGGDADGRPPCVTSGTELCEDFESGQLDTRIWKINKPNASASLTVDGEHVHGGKYALRVKVVPGQQSTAQIMEGVTFPAASNAFYTRIYAYFNPDLPSDDNGGFHMGFVMAEGNNDLGHVELALGSAGAKQFLGYSIYRGPPFVEFGPRSPLKVASQKWLCLELFESGSGGVAAVRNVWVDGMELAEQRNTYSGQKPPVFDRVSIGIWQYHPTPILSDMWIDDIRVSSRRIGCDGPGSPTSR